MEIARMEAGQVPAVAALERQCFSEPWSERTLAQELENPRAAFWAASEGGRLAGYAGMHRVLDEGYIANVAVDAAFRSVDLALDGVCIGEIHGINGKTPEDTMRHMGMIASPGMVETEKTIVEIMEQK